MSDRKAEIEARLKSDFDWMTLVPPYFIDRGAFLLTYAAEALYDDVKWLLSRLNELEVENDDLRQWVERLRGPV